MPNIRLTVPDDAWIAEEKGEGDIRQYVSVHVGESARGGHAIGGQVLG